MSNKAKILESAGMLDLLHNNIERQWDTLIMRVYFTAFGHRTIKYVYGASIDEAIEIIMKECPTAIIHEIHSFELKEQQKFTEPFEPIEAPKPQKTVGND